MNTSKPRFEDLHSHHYVACRSTVTADSFRSVVDANFGRPFAWLNDQGIQPAGAPFIRVLRLDDSGEPAAIEMGVPVAGTVEPGEGLLAGEMPAGRYLVYIHHGPYTHEELDDLRDAQQMLDRFAEEEEPGSTKADAGPGIGLAANAEYYEVGPPMEEDFTKWRTRMVRQVP